MGLDEFRRYALGQKARSYTLVFSLTSSAMYSSHPHIYRIHRELGLVGLAIARRAPGSCFVAEVDFAAKGGPEVFKLLSAETLPKVFSHNSDWEVGPNGTIGISPERTLTVMSDVTAELLADFVERSCGIQSGQLVIVRRHFKDSRLFPWAVGLAACGVAGLAYWVATASVARSHALWGVAAIFVFWVSVSGATAGFLKGTPLFQARSSPPYSDLYGCI